MEFSPHFKVVQIKEINEIEPVPHQWESKGVVYWPPSKREVRLFQSKINSIPNPETWTKYHCDIKAEGIMLFSHASTTADKICADSSTDEELEYSSKRRESKPPAKYYDSFFNYDNLLQPNKKQVNKAVSPDTASTSTSSKAGSISTENNESNNTLVPNIQSEIQSGNLEMLVSNIEFSKFLQRFTECK